MHIVARILNSFIYKKDKLNLENACPLSSRKGGRSVGVQILEP